MSNVKFKLNRAGVQELLKRKETQAICREHAQNVAARAGAGYVTEDRNYPERSGAAVRSDSYEAYKDNLENNTLLKSLF